MSGQFLISRSAFVVSRLRNSESFRGMAMLGAPSAFQLRHCVDALRSVECRRTPQRRPIGRKGIKIISGDNEVVTRKICKAIENAMLGKDVEALSDASSGVASRGQRA
jgi:hypothetical protein